MRGAFWSARRKSRKTAAEVVNYEKKKSQKCSKISQQAMRLLKGLSGRTAGFEATATTVS